MGSKLRRLNPDSGSASAPDSTGLANPLDSDRKRRYQSIIGSLMWFMLCMPPDLAFTVSMLSKFNDAPTTEHLTAATYTLWYLRNTANLAIQYNGQNPEQDTPIGYTDSDFAGDPDDRKSTSGYVFMLAGGAVSFFFFFFLLIHNSYVTYVDHDEGHVCLCTVRFPAAVRV